MVVMVLFIGFDAANVVRAASKQLLNEFSESLAELCASGDRALLTDSPLQMK